MNPKCRQRATTPTSGTAVSQILSFRIRRVKIAEECGVTQENVIPSKVIYVTPVWNTGKLAMNSVEISHTNGSSFKLPPSDDHRRKYKQRCARLSLQRQQQTAGVWELVPKYQVTVDYVAEEVLVSGYKDFSPFAVVVIPKVTVEFDGNGADGGSMENVVMYKSASLTLPECGYTKTGAGFKGWSEEASGSVITDPSIKVNNSMPLYAIWDKAYKITYDNNATDAVGEIPVQEVFYTGSPVTTNLTTNNGKITRKNYEFKGWTENADGSGKSYTDGGEISLDGDVTIYAKWEQTHFTVTYDKNGGEGEMEPRTVRKGSTMTLDPNTFTNGSKLFVGWKDDEDKEYKDGAQFTMPEKNLTLHAVWKDAIKITFYANNGTDTTKEQIIPADTKTALKTLKELGINDPNKQFVGWGTGTDSDPIYKDGEEITESYSISLYAQWRVTVHFYANGGTGTMDEVLATKAKDYTIKDNSFERTYYTFTGWNTKSNGTGEAYGANGIIPAEKMTSDVSLYAQWEKTTFKVTFSANGGTGTMAQETTQKGTDYVIPANKFKRTDYTFTGWNTRSDGKGDSYADKGTIPADKITDDFTLYAQWRQTTFNITFDKNTTEAVTGSMDQQKVKEGEILTLNENAFKRTNYTFMGWSTTPTGSVTYGDKAVIPADTIKKDTTLYAVWKQTTFKISFSSNGGSGTMDPNPLTFDTTRETEIKLPANTFTKVVPDTMGKSHYTFVSWNTEADGTGDEYVDEEIVTKNQITGNMTLYAQWDTLIIFDKNSENATGDMLPQEVELGKETILNKNNFKYTNFTFDSWNVKPDGSGTSYADQGDITVTDQITLYAQWVKTSYAVKYDKNKGGGTQMTPDSIPMDAKGTVKENTYNPPDTDHIFGGWNTDKDGNGVSYQPGDEIKSDSGDDNHSLCPVEGQAGNLVQPGHRHRRCDKERGA